MQQTIAHYVKGIDPVADAFDGTKYTDVFNMSLHQYAEFIIHVGVGATGTSIITLEACTDAIGNNPTAIKFAYQQVLSGDTHSAISLATATGFTTTAGSSKIIVVYADAGDMAATGKSWLRLKAVEDTNSPVLAGIVVRLTGAKFQKSQHQTVIA